MDKSKYLKRIFSEYWKYLALNAACKLNLFDCLAEKPKNSSEISEELSLNNEYLVLLLNALTEEGFLQKSGEKYIINETSDLLTEDNPESLKYACMNWADEHMDSWQELDYSIKSGKPAFNNIFGDNFFNYLSKDEKKLEKYHKAMNEYARDDYRDIGIKTDFSMYASVMDVGGGYGALINRIKKSYPRIKCYLFDLPLVVKNAGASKVTKIAGDFFHSIPKIADALILSRVLHDWDDDKCNLILSNCAKAMDKNSDLYIIENCKAKNDHSLSLLSINQKLLCNGFERSFVDHKTLVEGKGFVFEQKIKLNDLQTILKFKKL